MAELREIAKSVRSKNAGPFAATIDVFCGSVEAFDRIRSAVTSDVVADLLKVGRSEMKRHEIPSLGVLKYSFRRPVPQGDRRDRDLHGAQYAVILEELDI